MCLQQRCVALLVSRGILRTPSPPPAVVRSWPGGGPAVLLHREPLVPNKVLHLAQQRGGEGGWAGSSRGRCWCGLRFSCTVNISVLRLCHPAHRLFNLNPFLCPAPDRQVLKLLRRRERWLAVAAIRFLRTALGMKVCVLAHLPAACWHHPGSVLLGRQQSGLTPGLCSPLQDEFYNRYLVKNHLLAPVVAAFMGEHAGAAE